MINHHMKRPTCGTFDVEAASNGAEGGGWCLKDAGHAPPHDFGCTPEDMAAIRLFGATLSRAYQAPEPLTPDGALAIVRALLEDDRLDSRETEALEVLLGAADPARLPRLLEPGEEIPPGCRAELRAAIVDGPPGTPLSAEASGPYTRAQFAAAVDEAHAALHDEAAVRLVEQISAVPRSAPWERVAVGAIVRAHETLHRVGAGLPRVDCATPDPEAQRVLADLIAAGEREIPCGHKVEDLISGRDPTTGRLLVTRYGACLAEQPKREPVPSRTVLPQGTSQAIGEAVGAAVQGRWDGQHVVFDETPEIRAARERRDALREKFNSYDGGDRPMSPPVSLLRELNEAEAELRRLRGEA